MTAVLSPPHLLPSFTSLRVPRRADRPAGSVRSVARHPGAAGAAPVAAPVAYGRRRLLALLLLVVLALPAQATSLVIATAAVRATASSADPAPAASPALQTVAASTYVVRPGDTLWSIARRLQPEGDIRPLVDLLAQRAGGSALQPGQRLDLHGLGS